MLATERNEKYPFSFSLQVTPDAIARRTWTNAIQILVATTEFALISSADIAALAPTDLRARTARRMWTNAAIDLALMAVLAETHLHLILAIALRDFSALDAKLTATIALITPVNTAYASMETIPSVALVTPVTPGSCARSRSTSVRATPVNTEALAKI